MPKIKAPERTAGYKISSKMHRLIQSCSSTVARLVFEIFTPQTPKNGRRKTEARSNKRHQSVLWRAKRDLPVKYIPSKTRSQSNYTGLDFHATHSQQYRMHKHNFCEIVSCTRSGDCKVLNQTTTEWWQNTEVQLRLGHLEAAWVREQGSLTN